jgi:hypothetical protein
MMEARRGFHPAPAGNCLIERNGDSLAAAPIERPEAAVFVRDAAVTMV